MPKYPYSPLVQSYTSQSTQQEPAYPSPFIPIRLPIFTLVLEIDNFFISLVNLVTLGRSRTRPGRALIHGYPDIAGGTEEGQGHTTVVVNTRRRR